MVKRILKLGRGVKAGDSEWKGRGVEPDRLNDRD
jgi:hypothetical protein